jgi:hypothetical protein
VTYTRALAAEGKSSGIRVYGVAPGAVETEMLRGSFPTWRHAALSPLKDLVYLVGWFASFTVSTVTWRDRTFRGNGTPVQGSPVEALWSPSYTLISVLAGYRTKILNRPTTFALNVDNVQDTDYYVSATLNTGSWGAPRSFRFSTSMDF